MQLRTRIFLLVAVASLLISGTVYVALEHLLVGSYHRLEQDQLRAEVERARYALAAEEQALAALAATHAGAPGGTATADPAALELTRLVVLAADGSPRRMLAAADAQPATLPAAYAQALADMQRRLAASGEATASGVLRVGDGQRDGAELVAMQRLPAGDALVFARALDETLAARIAGRLRRDFAFVALGEAPTLLPVRLDFADEQQARGLFRIDDAAGEPVLAGRVGVPREIHAQAQETLGLVTLVLAMIMLLAPVLAELVIDRFVISRVRGLRDWASAVAAGGPLAPPQSVGGDDEIGDLTRSIGSMATHLDGVQKDLELAREQADRANRAKSEFLAGASHEIRTPLTAILGYAELLQDRRLGDDEYFRYLATIRDNGEELLGILNDVLDLSKVEAGRLDLSWEKTDIRAVVLAVATLLEVRAHERGLWLRVEGTDDLPARAFIDPARFRQILVNLLGNAIRYTDRGGVTVRCRIVHAGPANARLVVAVEDTGIGMDTTQLARLFRPFTQLGYGARRSGGTGLGLALSQEFARAMGGSIRVESTPGSGSVFTLELPLGDLAGVPLAASVPLVPPALPAEPVPVEDETFPGARVLLVEDNEVNCLLVEKLLEKLAVTVHAEHDGKAALEHLLKADERYDLVLLDMRLLSLDGYAIARRLRAADYRGTVVALTASAMSGERERALGAGCDDFIAKPLQARDFLRTCRGWLRRRPAG